MDIQLPDLDGLAVADTLKSDPATRHIPILAMTAYDVDAKQARPSPGTASATLRNRYGRGTSSISSRPSSSCRPTRRPDAPRIASAGRAENSPRVFGYRIAEWPARQACRVAMQAICSAPGRPMARTFHDRPIARRYHTLEKIFSTKPAGRSRNRTSGWSRVSLPFAEGFGCDAGPPMAGPTIRARVARFPPAIPSPTTA